MKDKEAADTIKSDVYVYEPLGSEIIVDLKVGDDLLKAKTPPDTKLKIGEKKWLALNMDKMHIFDKKTGKAVL